MPAVNGRNADPEFVDEKMRRIRDPHVQPLNDLADRIADAEGLPHGYVLYVDPDVGGVGARMLVLLDNPSTKAEAGTGSGLLSLDNDDWTARNIREAYARHGVDWSDVVHWNVVPFPIAGVKNGPSTAGERKRAAHWTREVVGLLTDLEIVLLLGVSARDGWERAAVIRSDVYVVPGKIPHCSKRGLTSGRDVFEKAIETVAGLLGGPRPESVSTRVVPPVETVPQPDPPKPSKRPASRKRTAAPDATDGALRHEVGELLRQGLTVEQIGGGNYPRWRVAFVEEARLKGELIQGEPTAADAVRLKDGQRLRWEAVAARLFGEASPRRVKDAQALYEQAKGPGTAKRSRGR